jgi:hypothetical protein
MKSSSTPLFSPKYAIAARSIKIQSSPLPATASEESGNGLAWYAIDLVSRRETLLLRCARLAPQQNRLFSGIRLFILFGEHVTRLSVAGNNVNMVRAGTFDLVPRELIM